MGPGPGTALSGHISTGEDPAVPVLTGDPSCGDDCTAPSLRCGLCCHTKAEGMGPLTLVPSQPQHQAHPWALPRYPTVLSGMGDPGQGSGLVFFSKVPENRSLHNQYRMAGYTAFVRFCIGTWEKKRPERMVHCHSESDAPKLKEETSLCSDGYLFQALGACLRPPDGAVSAYLVVNIQNT